MTCADFIDGFSEYIDGLAEPDQAAEARRHRDACPSCLRYEEVYLAGREILRDSEELEVGEHFRPRLQHRLYHVNDERALARSRSSTGSSAVLLGVAAVLTAVAVWPGLQGQPEVELSPIVVDRPEPRPLGLRMRVPSLMPSVSPAALNLDGGSLWRQPSDLLFQYAPVRARYREGSVFRTDLQ